jgi:hypothetical protein
MQAVKLLVVGLGVMILAGVGLLVYGITQKAANPDYKMFRTGGGSGERGIAFGETRVPLPEGCAVAEMISDGTRLYLRVGPAGACERILILEAATGRLLGSVWLRP